MLKRTFSDERTPVTPLSPGSLKRHSLSCDTCSALMEFKLDSVVPYNSLYLEEGYVVQCHVCKCLVRCDNRLTETELNALKYTWQRNINETAASAALWRMHSGQKESQSLNTDALASALSKRLANAVRAGDSATTPVPYDIPYPYSTGYDTQAPPQYAPASPTHSLTSPTRF